LQPPPYSSFPPSPENRQDKSTPKAAPRKLSQGNTLDDLPDLPDLPSVPANPPVSTNSRSGGDPKSSGKPPDDEIDFDDLSRRFEELKKRK